MLVTSLTLTRPDGRRTLAAYASGSPLRVDACWHTLTTGRTGPSWRPVAGPDVTPADVLELSSAGWAADGDVGAFLTAVAAGHEHDPFAGVHESGLGPVAGPACMAWGPS